MIVSQHKPDEAWRCMDARTTKPYLCLLQYAFSIVTVIVIECVARCMHVCLSLLS